MQYKKPDMEIRDVETTNMICVSPADINPELPLEDETGEG